MKKFAIVVSMLLAIAGFGKTVYAGGVVVIVNKNNNNIVDKRLIAKIYNGEAKGWESGGAIAALGLPDDNPETAMFCDEVIGKKLSHMKMVWSQMMFSGQSLPPKQVASDDEMKKMVSANVNAIGYIKASSLDDSVKVVIK